MMGCDREAAPGEPSVRNLSITHPSPALHLIEARGVVAQWEEDSFYYKRPSQSFLLLGNTALSRGKAGQNDWLNRDWH